MTALDLWKRPVTYGAVGATQSPDLMRFPPAGFRPVERRVRIGHGDARWEYAWTQLLTWGVQRMAGMVVELVDSPGSVTELTYTPVGFDDDGVPVSPATIDSSGEALFGPDGTPFLRPGDTANLLIRVGPFKFGAPVRVVYVIDEPTRKGFAYGTLEGHPEIGEEAWVVSRTEDGSVWMTIRAFSRPSSKYWWAVYPILRLMQEYYTRRYERALAGPLEQQRSQ